MPVLSLACHLPHNTPNIPSRYNNEQTTKQTKAINNSYIYISCKCDTNRAGHFTFDAYASRPVACRPDVGQFHRVFKTRLNVQFIEEVQNAICSSDRVSTRPAGDFNFPEYTVYPKKYAHGFVVLCFVVVMQSFIMNSHEVFIHIHQGCFAGTGAIVRLPQCQWSKPDGYGKISQCITTTKHSKAKTVCIFIGIYCIYTIRNPDITLLCTGLRTDFSVLSTCRASKKQSRMFPKCNTDSETISYLVSRCPYFSVERNNCYDLY